VSEWTGVLYGFYSNKPIVGVFEALKDAALKIGYQHEYNEYEDEKSLLFYKNKEMLEYHLENGYNTDLQGNGCFCVEAKNVKLHGVASLHKFEESSDFEPYDINLIFNQVQYYLLIVPGVIENSEFSFRVHSLFSQVLKSIGPNMRFNPDGFAAG
jgi:hypothetical protein